MSIERKSYVLAKEAGVSPGSEFFITTEQCEHIDTVNYLIMCGHYHCVNGYRIDRFFYDCFFVAYINSGCMSIRYEGKCCSARAGDVVCMDLRKPHYYAAEDNLDFSWIHVKGNICDRIYEKTFMESGIIIQNKNCNKVNENIGFILSSLMNEQDLNTFELSAVIYKIMLFTLPGEDGHSQSISNKIVTIAVEYMKYNISNPIHLSDIAGSIPMSKYHFIRLFKKSTGYTPYDYLQKLRMDTAKHLLRTTKKSIREIAYAVGYKSEMGFTTAFTEKVGISPGKYRTLLL